jgi:hypothetical protein
MEKENPPHTNPALFKRGSIETPLPATWYEKPEAWIAEEKSEKPRHRYE